MSNCEACGNDMLEVDGCTLDMYADFVDGVALARVKWGDETRIDHPDSRSCRDCAASPGNLMDVFPEKLA